MRIRFSRKNAFPLLLLAALYVAGAAQMARSYSRCELSLPQRLAAGIEWSQGGWSRFSQAASRLHLGSWLGNSWAPGSIGWRSVSASPALTAEPRSDLIPTTVQPFEVSIAPWPEAELIADVQGFGVGDCMTRPLLVLARPEVVVVTAEFPRLPISEARLADLPPPDPAAAAPLPLSGCLTPLLHPDPCTI